MKKSNIFASVAILSFVSTFGFTSCQQDNEPFIESKTEAMEQPCDSIIPDSIEFVNDNVYNYDSRGPVFASESTKTLDLGFNSDSNVNGGVQTRSIVGSYAIATVSKSLLSWAADQAYKNVKNKAFTALLEKFLDDGQNKTLNQLNSINAKLDDVLAYVKDIDGKVHEGENADLMSDRMKYYNNLNRVTKDAIAAIAKCNGDSATVAGIIDSWAKKQVNGNPAYLATASYMDFLSDGLNSNNLPMPKVYDNYVYQTTPWEHEGYDNRENLRLADVSLSVSSFFLCKLYCKMHRTSTVEYALDNSFKNFAYVYEKNLDVERRNNIIVCQIKDAHIEFNKKLVIRDIKNHPWRSDNSEFAMAENECKTNFIKKFMYGEVGMTPDEVLSHSLKPSEANAIYNYYNYNKSESEKLTFNQILENAGFDLSTLDSSKQNVMTLNTGASIVNCGHFDSLSNEWSFNFEQAAITNNNTFMVNTFRVGKEYLYCRWHIGKHCNTYKCEGWRQYDDNNQYFRTDIISRVTD